MIDREQLRAYEKRLREEKEQLEKEIDKMDIPVDMGDEPGFQDETEEAEAWHDQRSEAGALEDRVAEIDEALSRVRAGTYGVCRECGEDIEHKVLEINSTAERCRACQKKRNTAPQT
jgi:RNA polymerase-binding transcription factor DksA